MKKFINYLEQLQEQKKLTKTQLYVAAFGILLSLAITMPNYLVNQQQTLRSEAQTAGRQFYVDSIAGSDSNAGTSSSAPWQSLNKVNNTTFAPGDVINFKRGSTWTGTTLVI